MTLSRVWATATEHINHHMEINDVCNDTNTIPFPKRAVNMLTPCEQQGYGRSAGPAVGQRHSLWRKNPVPASWPRASYPRGEAGAEKLLRAPVYRPC